MRAGCVIGPGGGALNSGAPGAPAVRIAALAPCGGVWRFVRSPVLLRIRWQVAAVPQPRHKGTSILIFAVRFILGGCCVARGSYAEIVLARLGSSPVWPLDERDGIAPQLPEPLHGATFE